MDSSAQEQKAVPCSHISEAVSSCPGHTHAGASQLQLTLGLGMEQWLQEPPPQGSREREEEDCTILIIRELTLRKPSDQIQLMIWLKFTGLYQGFQCKRLTTISFYRRGNRSVPLRPFDSSRYHTEIREPWALTTHCWQCTLTEGLL